MMMTQITLPQHGAGEASIAPVQLPQVCARVSDKNGPLPYEFIPSTVIHAGFVTALTFLCWGMQIAVCILVLWVQNVHKGDLMVNFTVVRPVQICFQECFPAVSDSSVEV